MFALYVMADKHTLCVFFILERLKIKLQKKYGPSLLQHGDKSEAGQTCRAQLQSLNHDWKIAVWGRGLVNSQLFCEETQ